jgi:hypothetical protein
VSDSTHAAPPNQRPPPEVAAALIRLARLNYKRPFTGAADIRRRETLWLLRGRGASDGEIKARIGQISASVGFSNSKRLGQHLKLLGAEKDQFNIRQLRPIDRTPEQQAELNRTRRNERKREKRAAAKAMKEAHMTIKSRLDEIVDALDTETWRNVREVGDSVAASPAFRGLTSILSRQAIMRRSIGRLVALGAVETEERMGPYGPAVYVRRLSGSVTVH